MKTLVVGKSQEVGGSSPPSCTNEIRRLAGLCTLRAASSFSDSKGWAGKKAR
jgi:hypothetical protein